MWPMPPFNPHYVTISFSPHHISCYWFQQDSKNAILKSYQTTALENLELERLIVFNPSHISQIIHSFLEKHQLANAFALFCLSGPSVKEQFITLETATPDPEQFELPDKNKFTWDKLVWDNLVWDYTYLYPTQDGKFTFYAAGITRELLFQYQLLALRTHLNLIAVTPATIGLLGLYKHSKGSQFRQSQLGIELTKHNNRIDQLFDEKFLADMIIPAPGVTVNQTDTNVLLASLGLFLMRNEQNA